MAPAMFITASKILANTASYCQMGAHVGPTFTLFLTVLTYKVVVPKALRPLTALPRS